MPKSKIKLIEKYKKKYGEECQKNIRLKKSYDDMFKKNVKHVEVNLLFHNAENKWKGENIYLRQENSLEVLKVMKLRKSLEDKNKEDIDLKKEIEYLKEQLRRKEVEEIERMKKEIPSDF